MKRKKQTFEPLALVGMSCLFPKAQSLEDYWANIKEKVDAIREVPATHWQSEDFFDTDKKKPDHVYAKTGGFLDPVDFNPGEWGISPSDLDSIDTSQLLSLVVAQGALKDAGYGPSKDFNRDNVSVILGLTGTLELVIPLGARLGHPIWRQAMQHAGISPAITDEVIGNIGKAYVGWQENSFPGLLGNVAAGRIANRLDLGGTNCVVDAACGSALSAVNLAAMELWTGKTDMVITGGVDTFNDIFMYMCFCKTPALSATGHARPFSVDNDGTILGEGIGMVVLKRLSDAERDGDKIYACLNAVGSSSDGKGKAIYAPSATGQVKALKRAYEQAGISPREISMIEAHGTGTGAGDEVETTALKEVYGTSDTDRPWCALGSVKSQIGHTKAAAGSAGLIKAALALYHKVIPPTIKVSKPAPNLTSENLPFYLPNDIRPWLTDNDEQRHAAVSALGFGGSNFHVVLSEYKHEKIEYDWQRNTELITFSGASAAEIKTSLNKLTAAAKPAQIRSLAAESRLNFKAEAPCRLTLAIDKATDVAKLVSDINAQFERNPDAQKFSVAAGAFFSKEPRNGKTAVIFPGQGSQYTGMGLDLVCASPEAFAVFAEANLTLGKIDNSGNHLLDYVYPRPTYDEAADKQNEEKIRATDVAQPAIGSIALGQYRALQKFGFSADCFAGHSYGELVSLCAAGVFDNACLAKFSRKRGELMAQGEGDRGGMIAVSAERQAVEAVISEEKLDLVVANHNAPQQVVLSGKTSEIARAKDILKARKMRATVLNVAGAFHSAFVSDAAEPFHKFMSAEKFNKPEVPVYANTTADVYPQKADEIKKLLGFQLANQVRFVEIIEKMYADGVRNFIEVGPGGKISGLIKSILEGRDCTIMATDNSAGKRSALFDFARALAQLAAEGYSLDLNFWQNGQKWLESQQQATKPRLTFPVCGANYKSKETLKTLEELKKPAPVKPIAVATPQPAAAPQPSAPAISIQNSAPAQIQRGAPTMPDSRPSAVTPQLNTDALRVSQQTLSALQQLQQQTAELHRKFLEGQEQAQRTIMTLLGGIQPNQAPVQTYSAPVYMPPAAPAYTATPAPATQPAPVYNTAPAKAEAKAQAPAPAVQPVKAAGADNEKVRKTLLEVVSEKTGYPIDMLNLEMDMEADLGIDSIKRVEIMSAMQEKLPDAPVVQPDQLGKLRTLAQILDHLGSTAAAGVTQQPAAPNQSASLIQPVLLEVVSEKTGYPIDMLNLEMDMEADLGIDSIKRVEIMSAMQERLPDAPVVQPDQLGKLRTLAQILEHLGSSSAAPLAQPAAASANANFLPVILSIVSEKTGYPSDMLNLDMDMEADLGIDSIKRVEIMSAVQEKLPDAPVIQPDQLGRLRTLAQIVEFLGGSSAAPAKPAQTSAPGADKIASTLLNVIAEKTGYPMDMLNPDMDMEADLGIDSIKRVEILSAFQERVPDAPVVQPGDLGKFRTITQILEYLSASTAPAAAAPVVAAAQSAKAKEAEHFPLKRTVLKAVEIEKAPSGNLLLKKGDAVAITNSDPELADAVYKILSQKGFKPEIFSLTELSGNIKTQNLKGLIVLSPLPEKAALNLWEATSEEWLKDVFMAVQKSGALIKANAGGIIATVSRLDGAFGLESPTRTIDPVQGGLAGLSKTIRQEWPEVVARAIDLDYRFKENGAAAEKLVAEILVNGPAETGLTKSSRYTLSEIEQDVADNTAAPAHFNQGDVILVTGGARGVTAATAIALAERYKTTMVLLGRSPAPVAEPQWLQNITAEPKIKEAILKNSGKKLTPKELEAEFKAAMANREVLENLERIKSAGGKAYYYSADIRNADETARIIEKAQKEAGPVVGLVHGAGVLRDRRIEDKTRDQLDDVMDTKVAGLRNVLQAIFKENLKSIILFSSFSGRFGRLGQVDYSMANEVLNKVAQKLRILRPECRTLSFNWGPWDGGMVTSSLRNVFLSEGIGLIPVEDGARQPILELTNPHEAAVEIGIIGLVAEKGASDTGKKSGKVFDVQMNLKDNPWLKDHVINGDAVVPMAFIGELMSEAAMLANPGLNFIGYDEMRILKGIVMKNAAETLSVYAGKPVKSAEGFIIACEVKTQNNGKDVLNARASIILSQKTLTVRPEALKPDTHLVYADSINEAYKNHLFHGDSLKALTAVNGWSESGIIAASKTAEIPERWFPSPVMNSWCFDPLILDAAYQLMILWTTQACGLPSLPAFAGKLRVYGLPARGSEVKIAIKARRNGAMMASADIDFVDNSGQVLGRIEGYECTMNENLKNAFKLRSVQGAQK